MQDQAGATESAHILVIDDDVSMRAMISNYLTARNFEVSSVESGAAARQVMERTGVNLVLLDLRLQSEDGLDLLREIRARSDLPVIIMTGHRRDEIDRVVGLELGADDYLTKPLHLRELAARIRAVLRRTRRVRQQAGGAARQERFRFAGWRLEPRSRRLIAADGHTVALTAGELALLLAFLQAPRQVLSREQLLAASRLHADDVFDRSIDVQILRLRRKLEADASAPELIVTERGLGYVLQAEVESD
jgi:two-component system, OmpR family, response regulator